MTAARRRRPARRPRCSWAATASRWAFAEAVVSGISVGVPGALAMLAARPQGAWQACLARAVPAGDRHRARGLRRAAAACGVAGARCRVLRNEPRDLRATYFNDDGSPRKAGERISNPALGRHHAPDRRAGRRALSIAAPSRPRSWSACAATCGRAPSRLADLARLPARQARAGLRALPRLDRLRHAAAVVGRHCRSCRSLALLEPFELWHDAPDSVRALHLIAEASRLAFADRDRYVADPGLRRRCRWPGCCPRPISRSGASSCRPTTAWARSSPGLPPGYVERGTSHISIVDRWGNAVSFTTTIEAPFGARHHGAAASC